MIHSLLWLLLVTPVIGAPFASNTSARLLLPVETIRPGETFMAGIELTMKPGWHTYWRNAGDSGKGTTIGWVLPPGITVGEMRWPAPERLADSDLVTYVFHNTVTLLVPVTVADNVQPQTVQLSGKVSWLECEKLCLPGSGTISGSFKVGAETKPGPAADLVKRAEGRLPPSLPNDLASAAWDGPEGADERTLVILWKSPPAEGTKDFYPFDGPTTFTTSAESLPAEGGVAIRKKVLKSEQGWPTAVTGLLVAVDPQGRPLTAFVATIPVSPRSASAVGEPPSGGTITIEKTSPLSLGRALLLALLGGLILNIMPCVLPVIALKILGFVRQSGNRPAEIRRLGLIYAAGVWVSFLVLAGAVIAVKQAVGIASWGMQFGNPVFLVSLTTLVLLVALSLFGVFEINLTGRALDRAGELTMREGPAGAFFNGVLAVALATPCTAPFLAPALGYAFTASAPVILAVFTAVAFGLAAPYVVLSYQPWLLKFLPKPGKWMEQFKVAMGFPMLGTAVWLYTLAAARYGDAGLLQLGVFLVGVALAAWIWGEFSQRHSKRAGLARTIAVLLIAALYFLVLERELNWRSARPRSAHQASVPTKDRIPWEPWSRDAVEKARAAGRPILVDFTADWCWTCIFNERNALEIPEVRALLKEIQAVTLKGDYTDVPEDITQELKRFGRAGVPLVLVYSNDPKAEPQVLPEILTPAIVQEALRKAAGR